MDHDYAPKVFDHRAHAGKPYFDYPVRTVGKTAHFDVYSVPALGQHGLNVAHSVLDRCEKDYQTLAQYFGVKPPHFNVIVAPLSHDHDGTGGAYHHSCLSGDLYCDVQLSPYPMPDLTSALLIAQEAEVFESAQNLGWDCGASNGEGLSRVLAEVMYPGAIGGGYLTAADWLDHGRPDWVTKTNPTDRAPLSNGCAVLFLHWLHDQLKYSLEQICRAGAPTLGQTYAKLAGPDERPLAKFKTLLETRFPVSQPSGLMTDNPFPI
jgi:hypothetical protein